MAFLVRIVRLRDSLILVDHLETSPGMTYDPRPETTTELAQILREKHVQQERHNSREQSSAQPQASTIRLKSNNGSLHYVIADHIIYTLVAPAVFPHQEAFEYIMTVLHPGFKEKHGDQYLSDSRRPYMCQEFETTIKSSLETLQQQSHNRVRQPKDPYADITEELSDLDLMMRKNIQAALERGERLDRMGELSSKLKEGSQKYRKAARQINWELLWKQYGPIGGLGLVLVAFFWWRFFW